MITTRLAAIFDIDSEQHRARSSPAIRIGPIADTGEHDLVRGRFTRFWSGNPVARITPVRDRCCVAENISATGIELGGKTRAIQRVVEAGVEVALQAALV